MVENLRWPVLLIAALAAISLGLLTVGSSDSLAVGLLIQAASLILVFGFLRRVWLTHVGALFIVTAVFFHGFNELILLLVPHKDPLRQYLTDAQLGEFVVDISIAILLCTVAYLIALGRPRTLDARVEARTAQFFDWRVMLVLALPLIVLTARGVGYLANGQQAGQQNYWSSGISQQFMILAVALASFGFVARYGARWAPPVLAVQSVVLGLAGQREEVVVGAMLLLYALARGGIRVPRKHLVIGGAVILFFAMALSASRATVGRADFAAQKGAAGRLHAITAGISGMGSKAARRQIATDLGYRFDGNSFGAFELAGLHRGYQQLGVLPLENDVLLAVPSFIDAGKLQSADEQRSEKLLAQIRFDMPRVDMLPTTLGVTMGYYGVSGVALFAIAFGVGFGLLDRWLRSRTSPTRMLIGLGALYCVGTYSRSLDNYFTTARGVLLLVVAAGLVQVWRHVSRAVAARKPEPMTALEAAALVGAQIEHS